MPNVVVTISYNRFDELARRLPEATGEVVEDTIRNMETRIKVGMAGPKSGRLYGPHQASAPGQMPAVDLGNLVANVNAEMVDATNGVVHTGSVDYAVHLEYGTVNMAARPFMTPAAEAERPAFLRGMQELEERLG
jgi:hypothetical protein